MSLLQKRKSTANMYAASNKSARTQQTSTRNHRQQETDINNSINHLTINDHSKTTEEIDIDIPSLAPKYTETFLSTHFSTTISLLQALPKDLLACTIYFDNELSLTTEKLTRVSVALEEAIEDWDSIEPTETGQQLINGMEEVEKAILK